jgi:16S rRNA (adenine(1408)-N(1))-methyltransferase
MIRVVGKDRVADITRPDLDELRTAAEGTFVDVGTGDARFAYAIATQRPRWLVIGLDALDSPMGEIAAKALRKPARGGRANLVLLRAAAEAMPSELAHIADEVTVVLPWGRLLEGIVRGEAAVIDGLASIMAPGARLSVTLNGEIWIESTPSRYADLPVPTPDYVSDVIAPAFARAGIDVDDARALSAYEAKSLPTTWSRKLGHGRDHPVFVRFEGRRRPFASSDRP